MATTQPIACDFEVLDRIQRRVLWLSMMMVHHANKLRPSADTLKVGGHQASSASVVGIMTSLFFDFMRAGDRISIKPHASPVLHSIQYLLGNLDRRYLTTLRSFHGLQAYPSRTKDPDPVDFSTGSVGLGAVAPNFAALVADIVNIRFPDSARPEQRFISLIGDAELDEGSVWEAVAEPALASLDNVIWVVDLNRQSLDRIVPGIRVRQLEDMFRANGWLVIEAKYGRNLQNAFALPDGGALKLLIDDMSNEDYQALLRSDPTMVREIVGPKVLPNLPALELKKLIADLGGHDLNVLRGALSAADAAQGPAVIFAYTIKGWGLPIAGHPTNHSALLTSAQMDQLAADMDTDASDPWAAFPADSPENELSQEVRARLRASRIKTRFIRTIPDDLNRTYAGSMSTQQAFGTVLTELARAQPEIGERIMTVSPDVATSTNLAGWINRVGVWERIEASDPFSRLGPRLIQWRRGPNGQHIELGISETNLMMLLGQLGLSAETTGEPLLPIGTLYDPFVARALDAYIYSIYNGAHFILVGTPAGVTLAPEGGAHQSVITPSIGLAIPDVRYYEPCFALELEWILLESLRAIHDNEKPESAYIRLTTGEVDQDLLGAQGHDRDALRRQVLSGAYVIMDRTSQQGCKVGVNQVEIWATGIMVPEALAASDELLADGIYASVVNCTSPDLVFRHWQEGVHTSLATLRPPAMERRAPVPVVTVLDGHSSALAWVGSMLGTRGWPLGVTRFGESGTRADLYKATQIDRDSICYACYSALEAERTS